MRRTQLGRNRRCRLPSSASTAADRSPAGHGVAASRAGPIRTDVVERPVPPPSCHASAEATGDVSTAASSATETVESVGVTVLTGTPGNQAPAGSATASMIRV